MGKRGADSGAYDASFMEGVKASKDLLGDWGVRKCEAELMAEHT